MGIAGFRIEPKDFAAAPGSRQSDKSPLMIEAGFGLGQVMTRSLVSAGRAMTPPGRQRLQGDDLTEDDDWSWDHHDFAIRLRFQNVRFGQERVRGQVAVVEDEDQLDLPVGVVSGHSRDCRDNVRLELRPGGIAGISREEVDRVGDARDGSLGNPHDVLIDHRDGHELAIVKSGDGRRLIRADGVDADGHDQGHTQDDGRSEVRESHGDSP